MKNPASSGFPYLLAKAPASAVEVHGMTPDALITGAEMGNPERVGNRKFDPAYWVVSW